MDAFRLLSRSTTLSRQSSGKVSSGQHTQQQAQNAKIQQVNAGEKKTSKKRKRHSDVAGSPKEISNVDIDAATDFFRDNRNSSKDISHTNVNGTFNIDTETQEDDFDSSDSDGPPLEADFAPLSEEECKRILESHKIKISRLYPTDEDLAQQNSDGRKKKKSRKAPEQTSTRVDDEDKKKKKKKKLDVVPQPLTLLSHLNQRCNLDARLARNLSKQGYTTPTEIQLSALPLLLEGANTHHDGESIPIVKTQIELDEPAVDLLAVAPTGSGKTLAYLIPVINFITRQRNRNEHAKNGVAAREAGKGPSAIIVAPTKELAAQIVVEARNLASGTGISVSRPRKNMMLSSIAGKENTSEMQRQDEESSHSEAESDDEAEAAAKPRPSFRRTPDIIVCAPLSLVKAITSDTGDVQQLDTVKHLILDEADVLLDPMFRTQTLKVISACTSPNLRTSLWSATMGSSIETLATSTILNRRSARALASGQKDTTPLLRLVIGLKDSAIPPSITHKLTYCHNEPGKLLALRQLLRPAPRSQSTSTPPLSPPFLIFTQTIPRAIALASELEYDIPAPITTTTSSSSTSTSKDPPSRVAVLHADLTPTARTTTISRFRQGEIWLLITTDILSRGVDFPSVNAVINYDFPNSPAAYVHRVGRTGRTVRNSSRSAGNSTHRLNASEMGTGDGEKENRRAGTAITFVAEEDVPFLRNVVNVIEGAERAANAKSKSKSKTKMQSEIRGEDTVDGESQASAVKEWMLTALPKPTKRQRQELKRRGIEARRPALKTKTKTSASASTSGRNAKGGKAQKTFQTRISTKSGFDRRVEKRRRDAVRASRAKKREQDSE